MAAFPQPSSTWEGGVAAGEGEESPLGRHPAQFPFPASYPEGRRWRLADAGPREA